MLSKNPDLLEQFLIETTDMDTLEKWMKTRAKALNTTIRPARAKNKLSSWKVRDCLHMLYTHSLSLRLGHFQ